MDGPRPVDDEDDDGGRRVDVNPEAVPPPSVVEVARPRLEAAARASSEAVPQADPPGHQLDLKEVRVARWL